jgi:transcriptional regulator with XRE-family HTH domain
MSEERELIAFGCAVRQVREERGVSVDALAEAAGISSTDVEAIEAGCLDPGYRGLLHLPAALGITSTALLLRVERDGSDLDPHAASVAFGQRLRQVRAERSMAQDDLARVTGLHATAIGRFERGEREPRLTSILRLARGLGVKPGELVDELRVEKPDDAAQAEGQA